MTNFQYIFVPEVEQPKHAFSRKAVMRLINMTQSKLIEETDAYILIEIPFSNHKAVIANYLSQEKMHFQMDGDYLFWIYK